MMPSLIDLIREDVRANRGQVKGALIVVAYRIANAARGERSRSPRLWALPIGLVYRIVFEWILGVEIPWGTVIGRRLRVFHGVGIVINDHAVLGDDVSIRQGTTIGNSQDGGGCPRVGDRVELGASCILIGAITVGDDARIGAGAVVTKDVPAGATAIGVAARVIEPRSSSRRVNSE